MRDIAQTGCSFGQSMGGEQTSAISETAVRPPSHAINVGDDLQRASLLSSRSEESWGGWLP